MPSVLDLIDNVGEMVTAIIIALHLDSTFPAMPRSLLILLAPLWIQTLLGATLRCCSLESPEDMDSSDKTRCCPSIKQLAAVVKAFGYLTYKAVPAGDVIPKTIRIVMS
jgi:hypothetical protein